MQTLNSRYCFLDVTVSVFNKFKTGKLPKKGSNIGLFYFSNLFATYLNINNNDYINTTYIYCKTVSLMRNIIT